jgi:hypothetical protein
VLLKSPIIAIPKLLKVPEFVGLTAEKVPSFVSAPPFKVITVLRMALLVSVPVLLRTPEVDIVPRLMRFRAQVRCSPDSRLTSKQLGAIICLVRLVRLAEKICPRLPRNMVKELESGRHAA